MYRRIMVPLDGSTFSESALDPALDLARRSSADLHLVTVQEDAPPWGFQGWPVEDWRPEYLEAVQARLLQGADVSVTTAVGVGDVVGSLAAEVRNSASDLVVMATHGRGALSRAWLGSVTDGFVRRARRPVLVIRPEEPLEGTEDLPELPPVRIEARRVLVPLDGSELSERALRHAFGFGELFGSSFHLVRVVPFPMGFASPYIPHSASLNREAVQEHEDEARAYLSRRIQELSAEGIRATWSVVVTPQPARGILTEARARDCDLIAMATQAGRIRRMAVGSTTDKVMRASHTPLLLIHPSRSTAPIPTP